MKIKICILMIALLVAVSFAGCGVKPTKIAEEQKLYALEVKEAPVSADPQKAVDTIYQGQEYIADEMSESFLTKATNLKLEDVIEVYGKHSDAKGTLADIIIIKPLPGARDDVRAQLNVYKEYRISEFENYDILDAHAIAKEAVIYDQGEYLVLLMLVDNTAAQSLVDQFVPQ